MKIFALLLPKNSFAAINSGNTNTCSTQFIYCRHYLSADLPCIPSKCDLLLCAIKKQT